MTAAPDRGDYAFLRGISAYEVLGVGREATDDDIRVAHRRLISQNHPDHAGTQLFAQLLNDARRVLQLDREAYDDWLDQEAAQPPAEDLWAHAASGLHGPDSHVNQTPAPKYVPADGRPAYFAPPGAVPPSTRRPAVGPADLGPDRFTGVLRDLAHRAHGEVFRVYGQPTSPQQHQTYVRAADLLAVLRLCRALVAPALNDDLISAGLRDPGPFLQHAVERLAHTTPRPQRDQGLAVLRDLQSSPGAGVVVALTALTIEKLAGRVR